MRAARTPLPVGTALDGVRAADVVLPLLMAVVGAAELVADRADYAPLWAALATFWAACATLVLRRRYPLAMPPLVTLWFGAGAALGVEVGGPASWILPMTFACFAAGRYAPWPASWTGHWPGAVSVLVSVIVFPLVEATTELPAGKLKLSPAVSSTLPAVLVLGLWFLLQLLPAFSDPTGAGGGVAYFAHIGGFLFGLLAIKLFATHVHEDYERAHRIPVY